VAWLAAIVAFPGSAGRPRVVTALGIAGTMALTTVALMAAHRLYRARFSSVRSTELAGLSRSAAVPALVGGWLNRTHNVGPSLTADVLAVVGAVFLISSFRAVYKSWLRSSRIRGRYCRNVCVLGTDDEADALVRVLQDHRELGYRLVAVVGDPATWAERQSNVPVLRADGNKSEAIRRAGATGVIVAASAFSAVELEQTVRGLLADGLHVQVSTGLSRVGHQRMSPYPLSHRMFFYIEHSKPAAWQYGAKRLIDLAVSSTAVLLAAPILLAAALAIKLDDGGPVLYRQERVGRDGRHFNVLKFRTMVPDASSQLDRLASQNERSGPLFKLSNDPRVTRAGGILRSTSIDELPQLINVLKGEMSLVGPRPALPSEVAQFDEELRERHKVVPGITGLWQIEARDNRSFDAYRRLDLFYVDNWSIGMDLSILLTTAGVVLSGLVRALQGGNDGVRTYDTESPHPIEQSNSRRGPLLSPGATESAAAGR
jgi:exopolysaccharide biosynthesis polyprenyl glycosylphosphotransferase